MKYLLALVFCLPLLASAQTPVITSGKYIVHGGGTVKELNNQADAKKYAAKLWIDCKQCDVVIEQPPIRYAGTQSSSSASSSSKPVLRIMRSTKYMDGQVLPDTAIKQYWLARDLNGVVKKESIKPTGDITIYPVNPPLAGETWLLAVEVFANDTTLYSSFEPVQF